MSLVIHIFSFGYKYGMPEDVNLLTDVRFLPNPYHIPELRDHSGEEPEVREYLDGFELARTFPEEYAALITSIIPGYEEMGKEYINIGIGCTGGRHRSVYTACRIYDILKAAGLRVDLTHRDILKDVYDE